MNTGKKELNSILDELDVLKLPHMAAELQTQFRKPDFLNTGRLELIGALVHAEYAVTMENRYAARLKKAKLKGGSCTPYLAKALGAEACRDFRTAYYHCDELAGDLAIVRRTDYPKYKKKLRALVNLDLLILDDFLLHSITEDNEVKVLYDILERRNEISRSCIICTQREPKAWPSMLMEDEVSSNSILKRVTKHYNVIVQRKVID